MKNCIVFMMIICIFLCGCIREDENIVSKTQQIDNIREEEITCVIEVRDIEQWAIDNKGEFPSFLGNLNSWEWDEQVAIAGCDINLEECANKGQRDCIVAIVDTEVDVFHRDYQQIWMNNEEIENDGIDNDNNGFIDDIYGWNFCNNTNNIWCDEKEFSSHGTFLTGIMCAKNDRFNGVFVNSKCKVMCVKALEGENAVGEIDNIIRGINYAEDNGAKICCLSFSTYAYNDKLYECMRKSKMLFITPSANQGLELCDELMVYPACYELDNIICVGDMRCDGNLSLISNYGKEYVDIAAPGTDIISTIPQNKYGCESGSSCAVPYVAGLAGLIYSCYEIELNACEIKSVICENVTYNEKLKSKIKYQGFVNYKKALSYKMQ